MPHVVEQPFAHPMMPLPDHDEHAREDFIVGLKLHMMEHVYPKDALVYERRAKLAFIRAHDRTPQTTDEVHRLMMADPFTRFWSGIARNLQEMLWANAGGIAERQSSRLAAQAEQLSKSPRGSLTLDPALATPKYLAAVDVHAMPGGYHSCFSQSDIHAGAMTDRGGHYYAVGMSGRLRDGAGKALVEMIRKFFPDLKPRRILDVGCTIGGATIPIADAWPDAEVYAIDIGAAVLRYAHARAEGLGRTIHFSQQNAEKTNFADGFFDLVVSAGVFHETSSKACRNIAREMRRVLTPGGICLNQDIPYGGGYSLHDQFMLNWDCYYNAEPFWRQWTAMNRTEFLAEAGFDRAGIVEAWAGRDSSGVFTLFDKPFDDSFPTAGGGIGRVQFFGANK